MLAGALLLVAVPATAGETPNNTACDATGALVCAGADAGAAVTCQRVSASEAGCTYTWGWNVAAFSPVTLPGEATFEVSRTVEVCIDGQGCSTDGGGGLTECSWGPGASCGDLDGGEDSVAAALEIGQCITVTVTTSASAQADTPAQPGLASASAEQSATDTGRACVLDNGR